MLDIISTQTKKKGKKGKKEKKLKKSESQGINWVKYNKKMAA